MSKKNSLKNHYYSDEDFSVSRRVQTYKEGGSKRAWKTPKGYEIFIPKAGQKYNMDIIPYKVKNNPHADPGSVAAERTYFVHRPMTAGGDLIICPSYNFKESCPICEYRNTLNKEDDEDLFRSLTVQKRNIWLVRVKEQEEKGIQLFDFSEWCFGKILFEKIDSGDEDDEWDKFAHPSKGLTVRVSFKEEKIPGGQFITAKNIDFRQRSKQYKMDIVEQVYCLDDLIVCPSYEDVEKQFLQKEKDMAKKKKPSVELEVGAVVLYEDEEYTVAKVLNKSGKVKIEDEDGETIIVPQDEVELVEEEEKPKSKSKSKTKSKSKSKKVVDDDDDEDEEEDDDDDEEEDDDDDEEEDDEDDDDDEEEDDDDDEEEDDDEDEEEDDDDEDDDDEEEVKPKKRGRPAKSKKEQEPKKRGRGRPKKEEVEEEEKPKKKSSKTTKAKQKKDEDWDWGEEPKPKKRGRKKAAK